MKMTWNKFDNARRIFDHGQTRLIKQTFQEVRVRLNNNNTDMFGEISKPLLELTSLAGYAL